MILKLIVLRERLQGDFSRWFCKTLSVKVFVYNIKTFYTKSDTSNMTYLIVASFLLTEKASFSLTEKKLGSLSRFGRLRLQNQNDFHFNISMKSHIMNISQDSKCYFLLSLGNSSKNSWLMSCG